MSSSTNFRWEYLVSGGLQFSQGLKIIGDLHPVPDINKWTFLSGERPPFGTTTRRTRHPTNCHNLEDAKRVVETLYLLGEI